MEFGESVDRQEQTVQPVRAQFLDVNGRFVISPTEEKGEEPNEELPEKIDELKNVCRRITPISDDDLVRLTRITDPLNKFYADPPNRNIFPGDIAPREHRPEFVASTEITFYNFQQYKAYAGLCTYLEEEYKQSIENVYTGTARFIPIPTSHQAGLGYLAYFAIIVLSGNTKHLPPLPEGTHVKIVMEEDTEVCTQDAWSGQVVPALPVSSMEALTLLLNRPYVDNQWMRGELGTLTKDKMQSKSFLDLRRALNLETAQPVTIFPTMSDKELKRKAIALKSFHVSEEMLRTDLDLAEWLKHAQRFFMADNPASLPRSGLFDHLGQTDFNRTRSYLDNNLNPPQRELLGKLFQGVYAKTAVISGPSGSGKTHFAMLLAATFLLDVKVPRTSADRIHERAARYLDPIREETENMAKASVKSVGDWNIADVPEMPTGPVTEKGRVLMVACQNDTTDSLVTKSRHIFHDFLSHMGHQDPLIIRLHATQTEVEAIGALLHRFFMDGPRLPFRIRDKDLPEGTNKWLHDEYIHRSRGSAYQNIRDSRVTLLRDSAAYYIVQLAGEVKVHNDPERRLKSLFSVPSRGVDVSVYMDPALLTAFTLEELRDIHRRLEPIREAAREIEANDDESDRDIKCKICQASEPILKLLIQRAPVVVTTISNAMDGMVTALRAPHVIFVEEASRIHDSLLWGLYSLFPEAQLRLLVGDWRQLPPAMYSRSRTNPFVNQGSLSLLLRLYESGFPIHQLLKTSRFTNKEMLKLCQLVNADVKIESAGDCECPEKTAIATKHAAQQYQMNHAVVYVHLAQKDCNPRREPGGSWYCTRTAIVVVHDLLNRLELVEPDQIVVNVLYRAQLKLYEFLLKHLVQQYAGQGRSELSDKLRQVQVRTTDSFMGEERDHVLLDLGAHYGHVKELARTTVAFTRATTSMLIVGNANDDTISSIRGNHPLKNLIYHLGSNGQMYRMSSDRLARLDDFATIFKEFGI